MMKITGLVEVLESNMEGMDREDRLSYLGDVAMHGCISGSVGGAISYHETATLFKEYMFEILELIADYEEEIGESPIPGFVKAGHTENLYNYLVWFALDVHASIMLQELEEEE